VIDSIPWENVRSGKTVVFTAYLAESLVSNQIDEANYFSDLEVRPCWYPTIFFYDLNENRTIWQIFGAEQFICVTRQ